MDQEIVRKIISMVIKKIADYSITSRNPKPFPIGVFNRHVHLSKSDLEILFGPGYSLKTQKGLLYSGHFDEGETVLIAGPDGCLEQVAISDANSKQTLIEISRSDAQKLGVNLSVEESGTSKRSDSITVIGPQGSINVKEELIIARRQIYMQPFDAEFYGVADGEYVQVKTGGERGVTFDNVVIMVDKDSPLEFRIDKDEANAAGVKQGDKAAYLITAHNSSDSGKETDPIVKKESNVMSEVEPEKLITEETVRKVKREKAVLVINKGVICTPLARDAIKELEVPVIWR